MRRLLDFDLVVEAHGDGYQTRVIASPAGEAQASFVMPFSDKDLRILVLEVVGSIGRLRRKVRRIENQDRQRIEEFGDHLYQALFTGAVGDCLGRSRMTADSRDAGLRIRLRLPGALANVPWEYLYDAQHGFLGLDPDTALVRYLELPAPVRPFPIRPPLRILAMISAPSDVAELDAEQEWGKLTETLRPLVSQGLVEVDRLENGTLAALQRPLRLREYHVLHFIGHGGYDEDAQDGALALEDTTGKARLVTGRDLSMMIRHRSLRLVVLNACEGSRIAPDDPFSGVAQALARQGIPAVIAMQFEISDPAAVAFSQSFYQAIADGLPVDVATVEARRAMFAGDNEIEWATPVLYLRSADGRIFTRRGGPQREREAAEEAERRAREEAERRTREEAERQAREEAERQAREEAGRQAREEAGRRAKEQTRPLAEERPKAERLAGAGPSRPATEPRPRVPIPVWAAVILAVPLLILAVKVLPVHYDLTKSWALTVLCIAVLGGLVAAVEHRRHPVPVWTAALEFFFAWFLVYAIFKLNIDHFHRFLHGVPFLAILVGVGAIVSAVLTVRALTKFPRGTERTILAVFLACMAIGMGAVAVGWFSGPYDVQILRDIGPSGYRIGAVFLFAALLVDMLVPFRALARRLNPVSL
jgi:CHAT domain